MNKKKRGENLYPFRRGERGYILRIIVKGERREEREKYKDRNVGTKRIENEPIENDYLVSTRVPVSGVQI